ncbi:hypothetical protein ACFL0M_00700 [Thermodesulfobacteriota bacterium]
MIPGPGRLTIGELEMLAPKGVDFVATTLGKRTGLDVDVVDAMIAQIERAAKELVTPRGIPGVDPFGGVQAIFQAGTPLGFAHGYGSDKKIIKKIEGIAGVPATTMMTSIVEALEKLQIRKLVVFAPYYSSELTEMLRDFLAKSGFDVVDITTGVDKPELLLNAPYSVFKPAKDLFMKAPPADGLLICGGACKTIEILEVLEHDIGKPVISSTQASMWKILNIVNVKDRILGYGQLLETF